jgi:FtsH-binding integral membrane protein
MDITYPMLVDILLTMALGILAVWAREIYAHYDVEHPISTTPMRFLLMVIPGMFSGLIGGELASMAQREDLTWIFALVVGYGGAPVLEIITRAIVDIMTKVLSTFSITPKKAEVSQETSKVKSEDEELSTLLR